MRKTFAMWVVVGAAAIVCACPSAVRAQTLPPLKIVGNQFRPHLRGAVVCCNLTGGTAGGWTLANNAALDMFQSAGINVTHFRTGPYAMQFANGAPANPPYGGGGNILGPLRQQVMEANRRGIYVEVDLVDAWALKYRDTTTNPPTYQSMNYWGDRCSVTQNAPPDRYISWVQAVVDQTGDLGVLYNLGNESFACNNGAGPAPAWEQGLYDAVKQELQAKGFADRPVGSSFYAPNGVTRTVFDYITFGDTAPSDYIQWLENNTSRTVPVMEVESNNRPYTADQWHSYIATVEGMGAYIMVWADANMTSDALFQAAFTAPPYLAATVTSDVPPVMTAGKQYLVNFKVTNTGTATWSAATGCGPFVLSSLGNTAWGNSPLSLPDPVNAGTTVTIPITFTAPPPGVYNFQWQMTQQCGGNFGAASVDVPVVVPSGKPRIPDISDFNGDGKSDFLWQYSDGRVADWYMNGTTVLSGHYIYQQALADWTVVGSGDFTAAGEIDVVLQNTNGGVAVWTMNGNTITAGYWVYTQPLPDWKVRGVADFNGDGWPDILLQRNDGAVAVWLMQGLTITSGVWVYTQSLSGWNVVGTGDFNGDGQPDILLQNANGIVATWLMNGTTITQGAYIYDQPLAAWTVVGTGDFNSDGKTDILLQQTDGEVAVWLMNGTTITSGQYVYQQPLSGWKLCYSK
jgi:hypothetical protein